MADTAAISKHNHEFTRNSRAFSSLAAAYGDGVPGVVRDDDFALPHDQNFSVRPAYSVRPMPGRAVPHIVSVPPLVPMVPISRLNDIVAPCPV